MGLRVAIVGVSGFSGQELARLVVAHPLLSLEAVFADKSAGRPLGEIVSRLPEGAARLPVRPVAEAAKLDGGFCFLATPAEVSADLAPRLLERGVRVVDLSGAFRLPDPATFRDAYRFEHPAPALAREARFGIPELPTTAGEAPAYGAARLVANPGCYATSAIVSLAPLFAAGLVDGDEAFVVGMSGVTGAGRKVEERYLFTELAENVSPYRVADHQHVPEIELALSRVAGRAVRVRFVPHLLPVKRGLITTSFVKLRPGAALDAIAPWEPGGLVRTVAPEAVTLAAVQHTPHALVGWSLDASRGVVTAIAALDNLLKGAASQALQNLCLLAGLPHGLS